MSDRLLITAQKESFIVRVIRKKLEEAGVASTFAVTSVAGISAAGTDENLLVLCLEDGEKPGDDVLAYLADRSQDEGLMLIAVGARDELNHVIDRLPGSMIYKCFERPLDNAAFIASVTEYFKKVKEGDFKKSILVVDDDPHYLGIVREWLKDSYRVSMASSGLQAIKWLGRNSVDLILLDHEMPVTSGPQVLEMLRSDEDTKNIPVMFLTGKSDKASVMAVVALKPEGYFLKTIEKNELLKNLRDFFRGKKG